MSAEATIRGRVLDLERSFGPLADPDNPTGRDALLAADARGEVLHAAEKVLRDYRFNDEFVPAVLGGRLDRLDGLGRVLRPVFRRDASLGFGFGLNCMFAALPVWTAGTPEQQRWAAWQLLGGHRLAVVRHEVAHGNAFIREEFTAEERPGGYVVNGSKSVIANAGRATGLVVFARTGDAPGGRTHSVLLLDRAELPPERVTDLSRYATSGMRSTEFGGLALTDCPVPATVLVGRGGDGYELSLRASLVIRGVLPSVLLASGDTALRTACAFALRRRPDGRTPLDFTHARNVLTGAFLDLLVSDCLALVATRAAHLLPTQMSVYAAVATYLVPKLLSAMTDELSAVLGEEAYATDGAYGMFGKHVRDLPMTTLGHAGSAGRQASIVSQLPLFARRSWFRGAPAPTLLFALRDGLPRLDLARLALVGDADPLAATLVASPAWFAGTGPLRELVEAFTGELRDQQSEWLALGSYGRDQLATPHSFALADRYALVVAAAACIGVWHGVADGFLAHPAWLVAALYRLGRRLGLAPAQRSDPARDGAHEHVLRELLARDRGGRSFDLYRTAHAR